MQARKAQLPLPLRVEDLRLDNEGSTSMLGTYI